jgi:hypothetical protein
MAENSGKRTVSFKVLYTNHNGFYVGVVRDGTAADEDPVDPDSPDCWFMGIHNGMMYGNGCDGDNYGHGRINKGQTLTIQLDTDAGSLKFWRDGQCINDAWRRGVKGALRWAFSTYDVRHWQCAADCGDARAADCNDNRKCISLTIT